MESKLILAFHVAPQKLGKIRFCAMKMGMRVMDVPLADCGQTLGALCGKAERQTDAAALENAVGSEMLYFAFSELLLVLLVAFLVVGPKDLPKVARWLGRTVKKSRRLLNEIKKESGWDELEKEVRDVQHDVKDAVKQGDVSAELREAKKSVQDSAEKFDKDTKSN